LLHVIAFGVAHHACEEVEVKGDTVLITGCGPIGLCAVAVAKAMGATKIIATDVVEEKLATARAMGAHVTINSGSIDVPTAVKSETNGDGVGALIEV
jgi:threonine dehydrogenase-like Zn-dependent dehydrogenase